MHFFYFVDAMEYKTSDGFCFVCSKADTDLDAKLRAFNCDKEPFALCGTINILILFHATVIIIQTVYIIITKQTVQKFLGVDITKRECFHCGFLIHCKQHQKLLGLSDKSELIAFMTF